MSKFATKAAGNMFCQARYEAAKFNERLSSREGAAEELGVDRTRLARIELGSVTPYPEERRSRLSVMERLTLLFQFIRFRMRLCMKSVKSTPSM